MYRYILAHESVREHTIQKCLDKICHVSTYLNTSIGKGTDNAKSICLKYEIQRKLSIIETIPFKEADANPPMQCFLRSAFPV